MSKQETFTVIISVRSEKTERKPSAVTGIVMVQIFMFILRRYFFITVIKNVATQRGGGAKTRAGGNYRLETEVQR